MWYNLHLVIIFDIISHRLRIYHFAPSVENIIHTAVVITSLKYKLSHHALVNILW